MSMQHREEMRKMAQITTGSLLIQLKEDFEKHRGEASERASSLSPELWREYLMGSADLLPTFAQMILSTCGGGKSRERLEDDITAFMDYLEKIRSSPFLLDIKHLRWLITNINQSYNMAIGAHFSHEENVYLDSVVKAAGLSTLVPDRVLAAREGATEGDDEAWGVG